MADFGLHELQCVSKTKPDYEKSYSYNYKLLWKAPELLRYLNEGVIHRGTQKGDVYSFGIILFEIFGRQGPYEEELLDQMPIDEIVNQVCRGERQPNIAVSKTKAFLLYLFSYFINRYCMMLPIK